MLWCFLIFCYLELLLIKDVFLFQNQSLIFHFLNEPVDNCFGSHHKKDDFLMLIT